MTGNTRDDGALAPRLLGAQVLAASRRPARRGPMRVGRTARERKGGGVELPPQGAGGGARDMPTTATMHDLHDV
jgi:hypothetical protein